MPDSNEQQRWLAYELHDRLMPWIHGARMQLSQVRADPESAENLAVAVHCLKIAAEEGRALIGFLETFDEREFNLAAQLEQFVEMTEPLAAAQNQEIIVRVPLDLPTGLSTSQTWSLLRVLQQATLNAVQHAGPCQIVIGSQSTHHSRILTVSDNGIGFDPQIAAKPNSFGISSLHQRAEGMGAKIDIQSQLGTGTTVTLELPHVAEPLRSSGIQ